MTDLHSPTELLTTAKHAAEIASDIARAHRRNPALSVSFKGARDLVTSADIACEKAIIELITSRYPDHRILAEETAQTVEPADYGVGYTWVIDPIDGTTNYAHGHFQVGVSIACTYNGECVAGVVAAPFLGEVFSAVRGGGAFLNDQQIHCTETETVSNALITTGFPYNRADIHTICARIERVARVCRDLRRLGAASLDLCWVACGRLDAYFEECIRPWDAVAGALIVRESGGVINHFNYDNDLQRQTAKYPKDLFADNLVACTPRIEAELMSLLNNTDS
jgi:myo-inositol-1(or 4)-monophosphatase